MSEINTTPEAATKQDEKTYAIYPAMPNTINEIDLKYVAAYLKGEHDNGNISDDDFTKWGKEYAKIKKEKDTRFFMTYRSKFTKEFFQNLYSTKTKNTVKQPNDLDKLFAEFL